MLIHRTALHWACKRNHTAIIQFLIANGADINIKTFNGEIAASLVSSEEALDCPQNGGAERVTVGAHHLPIVPHYLKNPPFPYANTSHKDPQENTSLVRTENSEVSGASLAPRTTAHEDIQGAPLIVKLRVYGSEESDFIEVEVKSLSYQGLLLTCAEELEIDVSRITKIRKLPDIIVRKDRDVKRMSNGQELEVVLL